MFKRIGILVVLALMLLPVRADVPGPVDRLLHDFIAAFNSGDYDTMASFYENTASTSFKERRTEQEDRELYQKLAKMLGKLTVQEIEVESPEEVRLSAGLETEGSVAEFRFRLIGDPPRIDGFSVGISSHGGEGGHSAEAEAQDGQGPFDFLTSAQGVHQSQVFAQTDGSLLMVWVQKGPHDFDLYVARQGDDGKFSHPVRINHRGVSRYTGDEARPSVALGPDGAVAVAWTAANHDVMLAVGGNYGETFDPPLKLNQDPGQAFRTMPDVAFSPDGAVHTVWLDPREAPRGREEPSNLYYAQAKDGVVEELNLTARQEPTVCGCCRPFIAVDDKGRIDIAFRNSSESGYRDISRITATDGSFSEPQPTSPPIWKLGGCPMAGPIVSHGGTLWKDASTGSWRLLWSTDAEVDPTEVVSDGDDVVLTYSPRVVSGREAWVLVGADPHGMIMTWKENAWQIVLDDLPPWVSSAAVSNGHLVLVGNEDGHLRATIQPL